MHKEFIAQHKNDALLFIGTHSSIIAVNFPVSWWKTRMEDGMLAVSLK